MNRAGFAGGPNSREMGQRRARRRTSCRLRCVPGRCGWCWITRLSSQYFQRAALAADKLIMRHNPEPVFALASEVKSFGAYALTNQFEYQSEGIPFLRGTNYSGDFINFADVLRISDESHRLLHKSEVLPGMVLLSMSGSVGSVAVALDSWSYPINSNQDIAKIVPSSVSPFYLATYLSSR